MSRQLLTLLCFSLLALRSSGACAEEASDLRLLGPRQGVLLLRNGELIHGAITLAGDRYDVALTDGEIHIKRSDVELFCASALECYERKRSHIDVEKVQDHFELADWCLRQNLMEQAEDELKAASAIDSSHPRIALLERRIKLASEQAPTSASAASPSTQPSPARQLEQMLREMPAGTVETFTSTIQPLLTSQCSTSGCHGPQSAGSLRLVRPTAGRPITHRTMLLNLSSVLSVIDRDKPDASKLLTAPAGPHGSCKAAIFSQRDAARYRQLTNWVHRVANSAATATAGSIDGSEVQYSPSGRSVKRGSFERASRSYEAKSAGRRLARSPNTAPADAPPAHSKQKSADQTSEGGEPTAGTGKDPFDPEIFNQRTASSKPAD